MTPDVSYPFGGWLNDETGELILRYVLEVRESTNQVTGGGGISSDPLPRLPGLLRIGEIVGVLRHEPPVDAGDGASVREPEAHLARLAELEDLGDGLGTSAQTWDEPDVSEACRQSAGPGERVKPYVDRGVHEPAGDVP